MSKLNEIIVSQLPTQSEVLPCTAYLIDNGDGTHDRYVSDDDGNLSKLEGGIKTIQPGANITIDNTDPKNPIINTTYKSEDTLDDVAKRGSNSTVPISAGLNVAKLFTDPVSSNMGYGNINGAVTGVWNTYFGLNALANITTGYSNIALGGASLQSNTTGRENQAFGSNALNSNTTGNYNNAFGSQAGRYMVSSYNDAFGWSAMKGVSGGASTGSNNVAFGRSTLYAITTGSNNVAIGSKAGYSITTGSNNIIIGQEQFGTSTDNFQLNIGGILKGNMVNTVGVKTLIVDAKLQLTPSHMPSATTDETKKVVWNPTTGVFAVKDDTTSSTISANKQRFTGDTISAKTLTQTPKANSVSVILNGIELDEQGGDYTVSGTTVTLANEPLTTDVIVIKYLY